MKKSTSGSKEGQGEASPAQLIDARIKELGDWRGETLARVRETETPVCRLGSKSKDIDCRKPWLGRQAVPQIDGEANIAGPQ